MADSSTEPVEAPRRNKRKANGQQPNPPKTKKSGRGKSAVAKSDAVPPLTSWEKNVLRQIVTDFLNSGEPEKEIYHLAKAERTHVYRMAQSMGLKPKTKSEGTDKERVLTITRPQSQGLRLSTNAQLLETLKQALPQVERLLACNFRGEQDFQRSGNYYQRPSNFGLVGQKLVPPHPSNRNPTMAQDRQNLPIYGHRSRILSLMQREQVLIIQGATGSGKSTQLPQYILEWAAWNRTPVRIVVCQPRRIAAISVSERIAKERGEPLGSTVGYQIRMNKKCNSDTVLSLTTSGCLLRAMAMNGRDLLRNTTHLVIDEVHERDVDSDFLLLAIKLELENNPHLRLVLMSATMNVDALSSYFGGATVLSVEGRSFGVRIWHMEDILRMTGYMTWKMEEYLGVVTEEEEDAELLAAYNHSRNECDPEIDNDLIVTLLEILINRGVKGAVIVYLPGYYDMIMLMERIEECLPPDNIKILLLHSQVENTEMSRAFQIYPEKLKVILSTNIGQTSITIPDLIYVIDPGRAKMKTHDAATDATQLTTTWISQADAQQRAGRAGRLDYGICYRLYSSDRFAKMSEFPIPEMRRRTLDEICLLSKMVAPGEQIARFLSMALDPPQPEAVLQSCSRLQMLGILRKVDERVTPLGRIIAELPLGVQLAKCWIYSFYYRCLGSMTIIAAYHSVKDPFVLPADRNKKYNSRSQFAGTTSSDSLAILKLYNDFTSLARQDVDNFCADNSVCRQAMEMFVSAVRKLRDSALRIFQLDMATEGLACSYDQDMDMIRLTLTAGLYPKLVFVDKEKKKKNCHLVSECDAKMRVSRSSCLLGKKNLLAGDSDWLVYMEKTRTADHLSTLEHTTMVSSLMVALVAGKNVRLDESDSDKRSKLCLDTWIRLSCPTEFGQQLLCLRELMEREVAEMVASRRLNSAWFGPKLAHKLLESKEQDDPNELIN